MKLIKILLTTIFFMQVIFFVSCNKAKKKAVSDRNLSAENQEQNEETGYSYNKDTLVALVDNSLTSYYIYRGQPFGFEYEMLELFAKKNNMVLKVKIIRDAAHILDSLNAGKGDVAAANLTINKERLKKANFTRYLFRTRQVLVQRLPDNRDKMTRDQIKAALINDRLDLEGKTVFLRPNTSYYERLNNFIQETNTDVHIQTVADSVLTGDLIHMVASGDIDYTVSDENKAILYYSYIDNIDISTPMSLSQPIGWAVNRQAFDLLEKLNTWITKEKGTLLYNTIWNKYFNMTKTEQRLVKRKLKTYKKGQLSPYDAVIRKYAGQINWNWILLTAQIYQESQFNPKTISRRGAIGLMQLLPRTAKGLGFNKHQLFIPEDNIHAGTKHLKWLREQWEKNLADSVEIIKFTLGSYNVGGGHVRDARRLAKKYGLDPNKWDGNVAVMLINKSKPKYHKDPLSRYGYCRGTEPVNYVKTIFDNYYLYKNFLQ